MSDTLAQFIAGGLLLLVGIGGFVLGYRTGRRRGPRATPAASPSPGEEARVLPYRPPRPPRRIH